MIALTGYGQPSDRAISKQAGFDAHLVKPVRAEELLGMLDKLKDEPPDRRGSAADAPAVGAPVAGAPTA